MIGLEASKTQARGFVNLLGQGQHWFPWFYPTPIGPHIDFHQDRELDLVRHGYFTQITHILRIICTYIDLRLPC
jgi:hypothetical protein